MIFVTVGTLTPFDRLVQEVDSLARRGAFGDEKVLAQIGDGGYRPQHIEWVVSLERKEFQETVARSRAIVSHAGMGTIIHALNNGKPLLVLPRLRRFREHVNDHQLETAKEFESAGQVVAAYSADMIGPKLAELATFKAMPRRAQPAEVASRIASFLAAERARSRRWGLRRAIDLPVLGRLWRRR